MEGHELFTVRARDGQEKRWQWDSRQFHLPAGDTAILPAGPAFQAEAFFTVKDDFGERTSSIEIEPYTGGATLRPVEKPKFADEDGTEYGSLPELIAAVKERVNAEARRVTRPVIPPSDELAELPYPDLVKLAGAYEVEVKSDTRKSQLIEELDALREE